MFNFWKDNLVLRIVIILILWALVAATVFIWNPFTTMSDTLAPMARIATLLGALVAGIALVLNPLLEDYS